MIITFKKKLDFNENVYFYCFDIINIKKKKKYFKSIFKLLLFIIRKIYKIKYF